MKFHLVVGVLIVAALLSDETLASGRGFFSRSKSRTRNSSSRPNLFTRWRSSSSVTSYSPTNSRFAAVPPTSTASPGSSSRPSRPTIRLLPNSGHTSNQPSPSTSLSQLSGQSSGHSTAQAPSSSGYSSGYPSPSGSIRSLPPRSRTPSPAVLRIISSSTRVQPTYLPNQGPRNTFRNPRFNHPHQPSTSAGHQPSTSLSSNVRHAQAPKQPLAHTSSQPTASTSSSNRPFRTLSGSRAENTQLNLAIVDDFASRIETMDRSAGVDPKETKRKLKNVRIMKKTLKEKEKRTQTQGSSSQPSSVSKTLEDLKVTNHQNQGCVNEKSPDFACFDYYGFSIYWPPTVALSHKRANPRSTQIHPQVVDDWAIHGLWPSTRGRNKDRADKSCNVKSKKFNLRLLSPIASSLEKVWFTVTLASNEVLWEHEYKEHGSCATRSVFINDVPGYFKMGMSLHGKTNMKTILNSAGFTHGTTKTYKEIYDTISARFAKPHIETYKDLGSGKVYLNEIKMCYNHQFQNIDCPTNNPPHPNIWDTEISYLSKSEL